MYLRRPHYLWGLLLPFSDSALPMASPLSMSVCPEAQESPCSETLRDSALLTNVSLPLLAL